MRLTPFQTTLYLTNLPPSTCPSHLSHIITYPPARHGKRGKRHETGITMVQVYTVPAKPARRHTPKRALSRLFTIFPAVLCISPLDPGESPANAPSGSFHKPDERGMVVGREVPEEEVDAVRDAGGDTEREALEVAREGSAHDVGAETAVAYIHFCCESHLRWAKRILRSVTIDGRPVGASTKRFNSGVVKRLWVKSDSGKTKKCK